MATNDLSMKRDKRIWQIRSLNLLHGMASATIGFNVLFLQTAGMDPRTVGVVMGINALVGALSSTPVGVFCGQNTVQIPYLFVHNPWFVYCQLFGSAVRYR